MRYVPVDEVAGVAHFIKVWYDSDMFDCVVEFRSSSPSSSSSSSHQHPLRLTRIVRRKAVQAQYLICLGRGFMGYSSCSKPSQVAHAALGK